MVYGDSFADAANTYQTGLSQPDPANNTIHSWMWFLATFLQARVITYGVSGGSEQLCYQFFKHTLDEARDATIIYHTQVNRIDTYTKIPHLRHSNYVEWDKCIDDSTVHLYWDEEPVYNFKQGVSFYTKYHLTHCSDPDVKLVKLAGRRGDDYHFDALIKNINCNHATQPGNLLLAIKLTQHFKNQLKWETVF